MANIEDILITLHFLQIGSGKRGSFVARLSDTDVELRDVGFVGVEPIEILTPIFIPTDDSEWTVAMLMRHHQQRSNFVAAIGSGTFDGGAFDSRSFE